MSGAALHTPRAGSRAARAGAWYFDPAPPERLATLRVLTGAFSACYLAVRLPAFLAVADRDAARFAPTGPWWWLDAPLPDAVESGLPVAALILAVFFTLGIGHRVVGPAFAAALLAVTAYRSSWGQLLHFENLMVLHVAILAFVPAADALAVNRRASADAPSRGVDARYGWPVRLMALVTVATYMIAAVTKLRLGGAGWVLGDTLQNHVAYANARLLMLGENASPIGELLTPVDWVFPPLAALAVAIELSAPVALWPRAKAWWSAAAWAMHSGILASMFIVFPYPLAGVAFAPFFEVERLWPEVRRISRRLAG